MEESNHWTTVAKCSLCEEIPKTTPLYQCPLQHQYCNDCYADLRQKYRGYLKDAATCVICKISGVFTQSNINAHFLSKIKAKPGIGRPFRYNANTIDSGAGCSTDYRSETNEQDKKSPTVESLFQLPTAELKLLFGRKNSCSTPFTTKQPQQLEDTKPPIPEKNSHDSRSKVPMRCPHKDCNKVVAPAMFLYHFQHEHSNIPKYSVEKGKELCLPVNVSIIEHDSSICLALITMYKFEKIDEVTPQSSQNVTKTCGKFTDQIPIEWFWLMVTGSTDREPNLSSAIYWLFSPSEVTYPITLELTSKCESVSLSTLCQVHNSCHKLSFEDIASSLHCLIVSNNSFAGLLREGKELTLRITIH